MSYGKTLEEIMAEPTRPARPRRGAPILKTLGEIMTGKPDRPDGDDDEDGEIPTDEAGLSAKLTAWDAEIERVKSELFARKLAVKPASERDLARAHENDLNRHLGRLMVVRDEIAGRLQRRRQARVVEDMHADDGETRAELQKLRGYARAIIEKRAGPVDEKVRAELGHAISVREIKLAAR